VTTIAFKDNILAADTQLTVGDVKLISNDKIKILNKNTIFAAAGDTNSIALAERYYSQLDWPEKFDQRPNLLEKDKEGEYEQTIDAILIFEGKVFFVDRFLIPEPLRHPFYACGSGWQFAMSAMHTGLSAVDAVKFSSEFDVYTNDKVRYLNVSEVFAAKETKKATGRRTKQALVASETPTSRAVEIEGT
jgi:ATP-dependent protease HslVU (ClpYQ) peptidase subunit